MNRAQIEKLLQMALDGRYIVESGEVPKDELDFVLSPLTAGRPKIVLHGQKWGSATPGSPRQAYELWILNRSSAHVVNDLRARNESFVDAARSHVYLNLAEILIDRTITLPHDVGAEGKAKSPATSPLRDPFADRASLLSRVLLETPGREWTVTGLAAAAGVSAMVSTHVIRQLDDWQIVQIRRQGRKVLARLTAPRLLIETWAARYTWKRNSALAVAAPVSDEDRFLRRVAEAMDKAGRRCALTLLTGAWRRIQYTSPDRIHIYVDVASRADLQTLVGELGWTADVSGPVVLMQPRYRDSVWHNLNDTYSTHHADANSATRKKTVPIVSDVQLIMDLWHYPIRGRETAEQLLRPLERQFAKLNPPPHVEA